MTSLIFGSIWLGHKGIVEHRREKQRKKNYERWEGLRDEYDEQRKITRESRSLDIQRTGSGAGFESPDNDRPILTLRDQQEANDARTSWRPQESWNDLPVDNRRASVEVTAGQGLKPMYAQKTGATWDEGLPTPLRVSRRNWDEYQPSSSSSANVSRSGSLRTGAGAGGNTFTTTNYDGSTSHTPVSQRQTPSPHPDMAPPTSHAHSHDTRTVSMPNPLVHEESYSTPLQNAVPGGRMAELIEFGVPAAQSTMPFGQPTQQVPVMGGGGGSGREGGFQQNIYPGINGGPPSTTPGQPMAMEEWWNRP
jgi:hypothetical protein